MCSQHGERMYRRDENLQTAYHLILGQCSNNVKSKLEALAAWEKISEKKDVLALLAAIEALMFTFESGQDPVCALIEAQKRLLTMRQVQAWSDHLERYKALVGVVEHLQGHLGYSELEVEQRVKAGLSKDDARTAVKQEYLGKLFLLNSDRQRFGKLITELANARHQGNDNYPTTLVAAYDMLFRRREEDGRLVGQWTPRPTQSGGGGRGQPGTQPSPPAGPVPSGNSQTCTPSTNQSTFTNVGQESAGGSATGTTLANSGTSRSPRQVINDHPYAAGAAVGWTIQRTVAAKRQRSRAINYSLTAPKKQPPTTPLNSTLLKTPQSTISLHGGILVPHVI